MKRIFTLVITLFWVLNLNAQVIYVDADATGSNDGSSWQNAYNDLSVAIAAAQSGNQVWVAAGVYYPTSQPAYAVGSADKKFNHFTLKNGVSIIGGFAGDETDVSQRDLTANKSVLSGDIDQNDNVEADGYDADYNKVVGSNTYKLFYFPQGSNIDSTAVLDGFILTGARSDNSVYPYNDGGAFLCLDASPKVENCQFYGNYAKDGGGAVYVERSSIILKNCTFSGNYATNHGGAVEFLATSAKLYGCSFINNKGGAGGAVCVDAGDETSIIENCLFDGNVNNPGGNGGGISIGSAKVFMKNTTFTNNRSDDFGGGVVYYNDCDVDMINCIVNNNYAKNWGGGIGAATDPGHRGNVRILNSKIQGNEVGISFGGGLGINYNFDCKIYNSLFSGNKIPVQTTNYGGEAIGIHNYSNVEIYNCSLISGQDDGMAGLNVVNNSHIKIYNSVIWEGDGEYYNNNTVDPTDNSTVDIYNSRTGSTQASINGNTNANPGIITDPSTIVAPSSEGDFGFGATSPCNNAGLNSYLPKDVYDLDGDGNTTETIPYDLNGNPRIYAGVVDLGCFEGQPIANSGYALGFWGNGSVKLGNGIDLSGKDFTIELWYYMLDGMDANWHNIFGNDPGTLSQRSPLVHVKNNNELEFGYGDGTDYRQQTTGNVLNLNQWNHIALTFNNATNTLKLYVNEKQVGEISGYGEVVSTPLLYINADGSLRGNIDEFRVWGEERTAQELIDNKNRSLYGNEQNLLLYYNFDQITSGDIEDVAGINNGSILSGSQASIIGSDAIGTPVLKSISNVGVDGFTIHWYPVNNATGYFIDIATDKNFSNLVRSNESAGLDTSYTVSGLGKDLVYYYKVKSNFGGAAYQYGTITTTGSGDFVVNASSQNESGFTLLWSPVTGATDYFVDIATDLALKNKVITSASTSGAERYVASGTEFNQGKKYYYRVASDNNDTSVVDFAVTTMTNPGNALWLDGKYDYVNANLIAGQGTKTQATMECWAYVDPTETRGTILAINTAGGGAKYLLQYDSQNGYSLFDQQSNQSINSYDFRRGAWVHLAVTMSENSTCSFYLNGKLVGTTANGALPLTSGDQVSFGQTFDGTGTSNFFKGAIDEVRFWSTVRTQSEIQANMNKALTGTEAELFAYYNFDQGEGQSVYEKKNGLNATIVGGNATWIESNALITPLVLSVTDISPSTATLNWNAVDGATDYKIEVATDINFSNIVKTIASTGNVITYNITGLNENTDYYIRLASLTNSWSNWDLTENISTLLTPPGNALAFNGVDGEVNIGNVMSSDWNYLTLEAWVKLSPDQTADYPRIVGNYGNYAGFSLNLWRETHQPYFEFMNANGATWDTIMAPHTICDNLWHHIACTYDGTDMKLYLDGEIFASKNNPGAIIKQETLNTGIGNQNGAAPLNGILDEIRIWNIARTQAEIKTDAHNTLTGTEPGLVSYYNLDKADGTTFTDAAGNNNGTMTGGVTWAESKALITPFTLSATNIDSASFTATWEAIPNAGKYYLWVATDTFLTQPVEGLEKVDVGNVHTYNITGLDEHTTYFYGVMSVTDRESAWSAGRQVKTTGSSNGELAIDLSAPNTNIDISSLIPKFAGKNAGAITGWFKTTHEGLIFRMADSPSSSGNQVWLWVGHAGIERRSMLFEISRGGTIVQSMSVMSGNNTYLDGKWHHIAVITGDGDNRILIDGKEQEIWYTDDFGNSQTQEFSNITNPSYFVVGYGPVQVDELAFYKNPITNAEAIDRAHRKLTGTETGLLAYYNFDNQNANDVAFGHNGIVPASATYVRAHVNQIPFLNAPVQGVTVADLSWEAINGATQYNIDVAKDKLFQDKIVDNQSLTGTSYHLDNLDKNTKYYYHVKAKVNGEWGEYSATGELFTLPGKALQLNGVDQYLTCDGISDNPSDQATIECWVKLDADASHNGTIWANNQGTDTPYILYYDFTNQKLNVGTSTSLTSGTLTDLASQKINLLVGWHHIAVTIIKDGLSDVYIDGKKVSEFTYSLAPIVGGNILSIGDGTNYTGDNFKGEMDEFRVWNTALTQAQIRVNMNLSKPGDPNGNLIAHYTFDEIADGNTVFKDWAKYNNATIVSGATNTNSEGVIIPITLEATNPTPGSFDMHINNIASAKSFEIEVAYDSTFVPPLAVLKNIGRNLDNTVDGLCPGVKYYYRTRAIYDENTLSEWSASDTISTVNQDAKIKNLAATQGDYSQKLKLSWECDNSYLVNDFVIKRRNVGDPEFTFLADVPNNADFYQFIDTLAQPGTYYEYTVQGMSHCYNNDTKIDTTNVGYNIPALTLSKEINAQTQQAYIRLDWDYSPGFCRNVEIVRTNTETGITQTFQEVADSLVYRDGDVSLCTPYSYQLVAKTADYGDVKSPTGLFTLEEDIFDAIDTLDASKGYFDNKITLNWTSHKQNIIDEYQISRRKYANGDPWQVVKVIDKGTTQVWIDEDAIAGEYYEYLLVGLGTCGQNTLYTDSVTSVGFRQPEGTMAGQITYQGGNPVFNVKLTVGNSDNSVLGSCLSFSGSDSLKINPVKSFDMSQGTTVEMWLNPSTLSQNFILYKNSGLTIDYTSDGTLSALSGSALAQYNLSTDANNVWQNSSWNHLAVVTKANSLEILINGQPVVTNTNATSPAFGTTMVADGYSGLLDELRVWNVARADSVIDRYKGLMLGRDQNNMICNLRFDEGRGTKAFDHSRIDNDPTKSHGEIYGAVYSASVPSTATLSLGAKTEPTGNYMAKGIWFKGSGNTYTITPSFGVHEFDPANRSMLISESSLILNNQNFTDISSFVVTGNVKYYGADFPVEGVMLAIDGQTCVSAEGAPITTGADGNFTIEVPIGEHFISVQKINNTFSEGYFPPKDATGNVTYHLFDNPVSGIQFVDSTFMTVAGRIVGGTVEGDKEIGFGKSKNNLGVCNFTIEATKGYPIDGTNSTITVSTNAQTGEYEMKLYPEVYQFVVDVTHHIGNSLYNFNSVDDLAMINLADPMLENTATDTATLTTITGTDTTYRDTVYQYKYYLKRNWVYRKVPTIEVLSANNNPYFYDSVEYVQDANKDTVPFTLINADGSNRLAYPAFTKGNFYNTQILVYEQYTNADNSNIDKVPVQDGTVTVINGCATYPAPVDYTIFNGKVDYSFIGGFPNPTVDNTSPELSYTKTFEVHSYTGQGGAMQSQWPANGPFRAYVFGGIPTGQNFVTQGPDQVDFILRDPPGSNSSASFEKGFTVTNSVTNSFDNSTSVNTSLDVDLGWEMTTFVGFGAGIISTSEQVANVDAGIGFDSNYSGAHSQEQSTTYTQTYSTSDDPAYDGAMGDLYFGHSTNINYGVSNCIKIIPAGTGETELSTSVDGFTVGLKKGLNLGLTYGTSFVYTQDHIENYLIPNLEDISSNLGGQGLTDSASFYTQQADLWRKTLAENEYDKYLAIKYKNLFPDNKNISFDAGAIYSESMQSETTENHSSSFEFTINASVSTELGFEVFGMGSTWKMDTEVSHSSSTETENSTTNSKTVSFTLNDGDQGDYFSVDILKSPFGFGPVFSTLGGESACPYEPGTKVQYADYLGKTHPADFNNDFQLNYPTMQIEVPKISADNAIVSGVPDNQPAVFTLKLSNQSEINADNWFTLELDGSSNPYGAKVKMDGAAIVNGVSIMIPGGSTLTKTLEVEKGQAAINDYNGIRLILHSQCQFDPTDDVADIADTVTISANFVPTCTDVSLLNPADNWIMNTDANNQMPVKITGYNVNQGTFEKMAFQYKAESASSWNTVAMFYNDTTNYAADGGEKYKIDGAGSIDYNWDMSALQDKVYQVRATSLCTDGSVTEGEAHTGTLDNTRPTVFGTPSPADGILDPNDDIMVTFNEPVDAGAVTPYNIDVQGVLNGAAINHGTSVSLDGNGDYITTPAGIQFNSQSFTIDEWLRKPAGETGVIASQGTTRNWFEVYFANDSVYMATSHKNIAGKLTVDDDQWHHYSFEYDANSGNAIIYMDDKLIAEKPFEPVNTTGSFVFGKSDITNNGDLQANLQEVRMWNKALAFSDVVVLMNQQLAGNEFGLISDWTMDEGQGTLLADKARSRNATLTGNWTIEPASSAYAFNGTDQALTFATSTIPMNAEMDMTFEMWFKAGAQSATATLFSNGDTTAAGYSADKTININMTSSGNIEVVSGSKTINSGTSFADDQWHHLAFVVNRRAYATLYIDGEKLTSVTVPGFGSFQSPSAYVGAMGYIDNTLQTHTSNYFNGSIDEVRIWDVARTQEQIKLYMNNRLAGNEIGLMAYFPFEAYQETAGVLTSAQTLDDISVDANSATAANHCGTATAIGADGFTQVSPNIRRERAKTAVNFDYVINNDKLIITPTDAESMIEKCVLEITVQNIKDQHGNIMASPVTWTAYINKDQVQWADNTFAFEKEMDQPLSFTATVKNVGGTPQAYTISNLPVWLTTSVTSGTLQPNTETQVEFTVNDGLNIGNYNEDIYLTGASGYNESLNLNLRVYKQAPDWTVDPTAYATSMNIIGQLNIKDVISNDQYDMIGVFAGDVCRGVCNLTYNASYDAYYAFLVVYGNAKGEKLSYKVWDASAGKIYSDVNPTYDFEPNKFLGTVAAPVIFTAGNKLDNTIKLNNGWTWLSFNLGMDNDSVSAMFNGLSLSNGDVIKHADQFATYDAPMGSWFGTMNQVELNKLYRTYVQNGGNLLYMGTEINLADYPVTLSNGWNRIGYMPTMNMSVGEALAGFEPQINDVVKSQYQFAMYDGYEWVGSLTYMEPGKGYMYQSNNIDAISFVYPAASSLSQKSAKITGQVFDKAAQYEYNTSVVARLNTVNMPDGYKLAAYINGELRGLQSINTDGAFAGYSFITVYGDAANMDQTVSFALLSANNKKMELSGTTNFIGNNVAGDLGNPVLLTLQSATGIEDMNADELSVVPNPFNNKLTISFNLTESSKTLVEVYNLIGEKIAVLNNIELNNGYHQIMWDGTGSDNKEVVQGIYLVKLKTGDRTSIIKVVKN